MQAILLNGKKGLLPFILLNCIRGGAPSRSFSGFAAVDSRLCVTVFEGVRSCVEGATMRDAERGFVFLIEILVRA